MAYTKRQPSEVRDFTERFEFVLTTPNTTNGGDNIICQRYFKINNFNPACTRSSRITDMIIRCAKIIDKDLKEKALIYTESMAPRVFSTEEEMNKYFADPKHCESMTSGEGIVIREENAPNYVWHKGGPIVSPTKFNKTEFAHSSVEDDVVRFKLEFKDNGRVVAAYAWDNILPRCVKNSIDLSNKNWKFEGEDPNTLNGEASVLNKMVRGRGDLVYRIVKEICATCSTTDESWLKEADDFGEEATIQATDFKYVHVGKFE